MRDGGRTGGNIAVVSGSAGLTSLAWWLAEAAGMLARI